MFPAEVGGLTSVLFSDELLVYSYFSPSGFDIYEKSIFIGFLLIIFSCLNNSSGRRENTELTHPSVMIIFSINSGSLIAFCSSILGLLHNTVSYVFLGSVASILQYM